MDLTKPVWNSLEITKLIVAALGPIVVAVFGIWIRKEVLRLEHKVAVSKAILEWRIRLYEEIVSRINDIMCFACFLGDWRSLTPVAVVDKKRSADKLFHVYAPLWSAEFQKVYRRFMQTAFKTYTGKGNPAQIRRDVAAYRAALGEHWREEWVELFVLLEAEVSSREMINQSYRELVAGIARELEIENTIIPSSELRRSDILRNRSNG